MSPANSLFFCLIFVFGAPCQLYAEETNNYVGDVGGQKLSLTLTWHDNGAVSGSYFCPGGRNRVYILQGTNLRQGELLLTEYTEGTPTASIKALKNIEGGFIVWRGMMYNYDGRNKSMNFQRVGKSAVPQYIKEPSDNDDEEYASAMARAEILEANADAAEAERAEKKRSAQVVLKEVAAAWSVDPKANDIPKGLPVALASKLEQAAAGPSCTPSLALAHAVQRILSSEPLNLAAMANLLQRESRPESADIPWVDGFCRILENRRKQALLFQEESLKLLEDGDERAAELRIERALVAYHCPSLHQYTSALALYNKLSRDKALRAVDVWNNPSLLDREWAGKASSQASALRELSNNDILPGFLDLALGLDAAGLLDEFSAECEPAGALGQPHPLRALSSMRKSEIYRQLQQSNSIFIKPFLSRIQYLEGLIGPKAAEYEQYTERGKILEGNGKFIEAAAAYRKALGIEFSRQLEEIILTCESKSSGL
jgi:tetratricopeptide (TPR) repeat protein